MNSYTEIRKKVESDAKTDDDSHAGPVAEAPERYRYRTTSLATLRRIDELLALIEGDAAGTCVVQ